jgi:hypothetical protein
VIGYMRRCEGAFPDDFMLFENFFFYPSAKKKFNSLTFG